MRLRRARPGELDEIGQLTAAAYALLLPGETDYVEQLRDAARRDREAELWVATADDDVELLGTVTLCPDGSPWREVARPGEGEFRMLAVAPAAQGQGVGQALVELAVDVFRTDGCSAVVLCSSTTMTSAHRLYARLGFTRTPDRDWSPAPGVDLLGYRKEL